MKKGIKQGDFVLVDYIIKYDNGKVFDTTMKEVAEKEGIEFPRKVFGPLLVIVGTTPILKGFEEALIGMKKGESKVIKIPPEKAFGEKRNPNLVKVFPKDMFDTKKLAPGEKVITIDGTIGKILSVEGNRVKVDLNHELVGKEIEMEIKVVDVLEKEVDKLEKLAELVFGSDVKVKKTRSGYEIYLEPKHYLQRDILLRKAELLVSAKNTLGIDELKYVETWSEKNDDNGRN